MAVVHEHDDVFHEVYERNHQERQHLAERQKQQNHRQHREEGVKQDVHLACFVPIRVNDGHLEEEFPERFAPFREAGNQEKEDKGRGEGAGDAREIHRFRPNGFISHGARLPHKRIAGFPVKAGRGLAISHENLVDALKKGKAGILIGGGIVQFRLRIRVQDRGRGVIGIGRPVFRCDGEIRVRDLGRAFFVDLDVIDGIEDVLAEFFRVARGANLEFRFEPVDDKIVLVRPVSLPAGGEIIMPDGIVQVAIMVIEFCPFSFVRDELEIPVVAFV